MAPARSDDDWSDSDDDDLSQVETSVLLGVPDGSIDDESDLVDAAVSRIGGLPVRSSSVMYYVLQNVLTYVFPLLSIYICIARRFYRRMNLPLLHLCASPAMSLWSCLSKCGVHLRTVRWTELYTFGVARGRAVKEQMAGKHHLS